MHIAYEAVIGLEIHTELQTQSKMFCACPVLDVTQAAPNSAVCPICAGMPGVLPVVNQRAVEYAVRVALALECKIAPTSIFARKNYFYPDLPKGYQISQYEHPLAVNGRLAILTAHGEHIVNIRRVHLEEDTGKLTHVTREGESYSLVDLNRAGVPLLEIVSEPDLHSAEDVRLYAESLRRLLRYLGVNSGDMQKGVLRIEPNVSVRPLAGAGESQSPLGTRTEIKNLNSFRALERSVNYEIQRQMDLLRRGLPVIQETRGWDDVQCVTIPQRTKEEAHDYRYFPEPDLPPLFIGPQYLEEVASTLPELPDKRLTRFQTQYGLSSYDAATLIAERPVADFFEDALLFDAKPKPLANWITGELFSMYNQAGVDFSASPISPSRLAELVLMAENGKINQTTAKAVLVEMYESGESAWTIVERRGLQQVSDAAFIAGLVKKVLDENPQQVAAYLSGKETIIQWLFGQVMRLAQGKADPQVIRQELSRQLTGLK